VTILAKRGVESFDRFRFEVAKDFASVVHMHLRGEESDARIALLYGIKERAGLWESGSEGRDRGWSWGGARVEDPRDKLCCIGHDVATEARAVEICRNCNDSYEE